MNLKPKYVLSDAECHDLLRDRQVTLEEPGTLLRDVAILLDAIGVEGVRTSSGRGNIPSGMLPDLNARLHDPVELDLKRPLLRDYPNVAGPYILLRLMGLVRSDRSRVCVDEDCLARWQSLNPCEQYFALLKTWMFEATGEVLGKGSRERDAPCTGALLFLTQALGKGWKRFEDHVHIYGGFGMGGIPAWSAQLMMRLGLIELKARPLKQRGGFTASKGWIMGKARRTDWGEAVTRAILDQAAALHGGSELSLWLDLPEMDPGLIVEGAFSQYFPEYRNSFESPKAQARSGAFVFRVAYHKRYGPDDVWRELAVPHDATLHGLHRAVLDAFGFWDDDHAYDWTVRERSGRTRDFVHPECEPMSVRDGWADQVRLGELDLPERGTLDFRFDYGNTWRFVLTLQRIDPPVTEIQLLTSHGKALPQYPSDEDE